MTLLQDLTSKILNRFEKRKSEGSWNFHILFQAYNLALRGLGREEDASRVQEFLASYEWKCLKKALENTPNESLFEKKPKKTIQRFERIGETHHYRPVQPNDPYPHQVRQNYYEIRKPIFMKLNSWMHEAYNIIYKFLEVKEERTDRDSGVKESLNFDTISVLSNQYND